MMGPSGLLEASPFMLGRARGRIAGALLRSFDWLAEQTEFELSVTVSKLSDDPSGRIKPWVSDIRPTRCDEGDTRLANVFKVDVILSV